MPRRFIGELAGGVTLVLVVAGAAVFLGAVLFLGVAVGTWLHELA